MDAPLEAVLEVALAAASGMDLGLDDQLRSGEFPGRGGGFVVGEPMERKAS